ncbi:peptidoglycan-binding domain-containing protein [Streptomyces sp. NPDC048845]|uniref:peptidoglycan-binding domain-containing protein n=1 Tax=Streptomyces sp. NPDC048845 TaxID=3155390 RepID=UPI00343BD422
MDTGPDSGRPPGRRVIEPTGVFRAGEIRPPGAHPEDGGAGPESWMDDLELFRSEAPADGRGTAGDPGPGDVPHAAYLRDRPAPRPRPHDRPAPRSGPRDRPSPGTRPSGSAAPGTHSRARAAARARHAEEDTADLPRIPAGPVYPPRARRGRRPRFRAVLVAGAAGFAAALALQSLGQDGTGERPPSAGAPAPAAPEPGPEAVPPEGAGAAEVLRPGDSGPDVVDLQNRLSRIPDVYTGGSRDGRYDAVLAEAVARFQLWYGIRGDEDGIYGDDTRRDLEART